MSGWGRTGYGEGTSDVKRKAELTIHETSRCQHLFNHNRSSKVVTNNTVCAGGEGKSPCKGDSGGPLTCNNGEPYLCGISSMAPSCESQRLLDVHRLAVFTDVRKYYGWIMKHIPVNDQSSCNIGIRLKFNVTKVALTLLLTLLHR